MRKTLDSLDYYSQNPHIYNYPRRRNYTNTSSATVWYSHRRVSSTQKRRDMIHAYNNHVNK